MISDVVMNRMVPTAATVGSASRVMRGENLHRQCLQIRVGDEQRDDDLVEGGHEGEQQAGQHARRDERQRHGAKRGQRAGAEAGGCGFQPPVEDFEAGRDGDKNERQRQGWCGQARSRSGCRRDWVSR